MRLFAAGTGVIVSIHAVLGLETDMVYLIDAAPAYVVAEAIDDSFRTEHERHLRGYIVLSILPPPR